MTNREIHMRGNAVSIGGSDMSSSRMVTIVRSAALLFAIAASTTLDARVTKITIVRTESPTYSGQSFGGVGQYERIIGTATGEIDPADRRNAIIQDVQLAPRNANGKVQYTASFTLVKPIDMS